MGKEVISTKEAPGAIGPYSQGIKTNNLIFTAGQIPLTKSGELVSGDFKEEVRQVLRNLDAVLKAGGSSLKDAIKLTVYLSDLSNFSLLNEVFEEFFETDYPARSAVEVAGLPKGVRIEIEAIGLAE